MQLNRKGFTVKETVVVIFIITVLSGIIAPFAIRSASRIMAKTHAAADAATLHTVEVNTSIALLEGSAMQEAAEQISPAVCETDSDAKLWLNYSKPVSLNAYFVAGDTYYGIDYLSDVATKGFSDLDLKEPLTLGFWYEAGAQN